LLRKKEHGEKIEVPREREPAKVINLMDALRKSAKGERSAASHSRPRRTAHHRSGAKKARSTARHRKAS
jgi:non-homologous end joining protein Ku